MSILKYLQSKKILPTKEVLIKNEAKRLAKQITKPEYFLLNLTNKEIVDFYNKVGDELQDIMLQRLNALRLECENTEDAIAKFK
jgi:hypothetical protein